MFHRDASTKSDDLISERAFWLVFLIYFLFFIAVTGALAADVSNEAGRFGQNVVSGTSPVEGENLSSVSAFDPGNTPLLADNLGIDPQGGISAFQANLEILSRSRQLLTSQTKGLLTNINLRGGDNMTIKGGPGETVSLSLKNFTMSGNSSLTLQGTSNTYFVINVTKQFSLSGNARIVLAGDVCWNQVFFKIAGTGSLSIGGNSSLTGVLTATQRTVSITDNATVWGTVTAWKIQLRGAGHIITPPVVSQ